MDVCNCGQVVELKDTLKCNICSNSFHAHFYEEHDIPLRKFFTCIFCRQNLLHPFLKLKNLLVIPKVLEVEENDSLEVDFYIREKSKAILMLDFNSKNIDVVAYSEVQY